MVISITTKSWSMEKKSTIFEFSQIWFHEHVKRPPAPQKSVLGFGLAQKLDFWGPPVAVSTTWRDNSQVLCAFLYPFYHSLKWKLSKIIIFLKKLFQNLLTYLNGKRNFIGIWINNSISNGNEMFVPSVLPSH